MRGSKPRTWSICASVLLLHACLEPNPNAVETSTSESDTGTSDTTTGAPVCADIGDPDACAATGDCQPVSGSRLKQNGPDSPCLEPAEFLGCIAAQACDEALTWFCQGNGMYQVADSCGPEGFDACEGPVDPIDACP